MGHVAVRDHGYAALFERLHRKPAEVTVGVHEDVGSLPHPGPIRGRKKREKAGKQSTATISDVATWLEIGTSRAPSRSFVRDWADENESAHKDLLRKVGAGVVNGKIASPDEGCRLLGEKLKGSMVRRMGDGIPPPNAPATIERKGSSTPGIDSGTVRKSVDFKVT